LPAEGSASNQKGAMTAFGLEVLGETDGGEWAFEGLTKLR
jgi:hypothetical protein